MADISKAQHFYKQGLRFFRCAERCMGDVNDDGSIQIIGGKYQILPTPVMVNSAFSCELFLKAILIASGIKYDNTHGLKPLFELLPEKEYKDFLIIGDDGGKEFMLELDKHSNDFVAWRYYMEKPGEYSMEPTFTYILMNNLKSLAKAVINKAESEQGG